MNNESLLLNVFQEGLRRGVARLPHDPAKRYAYVEHPIEGWRVYLRSAVFIHETARTASFNPMKFLVVKRRGARMTTAAWEPPKGQMEGKDLLGIHGKGKPILDILAHNARRETYEESHIVNFETLIYTGLVFQGREKDYPPNTYFQYHIFQATVSPSEISHSFQTFNWIRNHRKEFAEWSRDRREKDAVAWFNARETRLNPRWTPAIVAIYLKQFV
jgi:8-oxo-dGTP pyrophosphatase MutT (NUDIX family)